MKIEFGSTTLGDDSAGDFIAPAFSRSHTRALQAEDLLGAANPATFPRGNARNAIAFVVAKEHASIAAAIVYLLSFPDGLDAQATLKFTESTSIYEMLNACFAGAELVDVTGKSTAMRFNFTGGAVTVHTP